jgi:hypothetical protein
MSLIKLVQNSNLDNLYSKLECHVVSKAFSMSKNTAAVEILLLKLRDFVKITPRHGLRRKHSPYIVVECVFTAPTGLYVTIYICIDTRTYIYLHIKSYLAVR